MADIFQVRERALEYEFFHKVDERLWEQLRRRMVFDERRAALADATGISSPAVLDELVELEITNETLFALSLFPLVWVAWADGKIQAGERQAIMEAAQAGGHESNSASHQVIESWLNHRPHEKLQTAWKDYARFVSKTLSTEARQSLKQDVLQRARRVAQAMAVPYGSHGAETAQDAILREIEKAFDAR